MALVRGSAACAGEYKHPYPNGWLSCLKFRNHYFEAREAVKT